MLWEFYLLIFVSVLNQPVNSQFQNAERRKNIRISKDRFGLRNIHQHQRSFSGFNTTIQIGAVHMFNMFSEPTTASRKLARCGYLSIMAKKEINKRMKQQYLHGFTRAITLRNKWLEDYKKECIPSRTSIKCNANLKYRTINGECNNLRHHDWGMSETAQGRYLKPSYDDAIDSPRFTESSGKPLPSARVVSNALHRSTQKTSFDPDLTVLHMSFGQFLDHDLIATPLMKGENNTDIQCCAEKNRKRPECIIIDIPRDDPYYVRSCMSVVRSLPAPPPDKVPGNREQLNEVTSFIDASAVYGSTNITASNLREFKKGRMRMNSHDRLPKGGKSKCFFESKTDYCQQAGDKRVNVVPNLGAIHLLFVREHNRIAEHLSIINPSWDDETLYQETRKIVSAIIQHITYNEYLPLILNSFQMKTYILNSKQYGFDLSYDDKLNPSVRNVFGAAAFRFGHSQVPNHQASFDKYRRPTLVRPIEDTYHRPYMCVMEDGRGADGVIRWMTTAHSTSSDRFFESGVRDKLFEDKNKISMDLPAVNIQRGRDHGIPGYNKWRKFCNLPEANSFTDLRDHEPNVALILSKLYSHPDDIDLFAGAMSEIREESSLVGPTFACIIGKQFQALKRGDRFWYENPYPQTGFRLAQLNSIKKITMSKIICNDIHMHEMQANAFKVPGRSNPRRLCSLIPGIDLRLWKT